MTTCPAIVARTRIVCGNPSKFGVYCGVHKRVGEEIQKKKDEIAKRISECDGDGSCLDGDGYDSLGCNHCKPKRCPKCRDVMPEWVLHCNYGYCINCAVEEYNKDEKKFMARKWDGTKWA